MRTNKRVIGMIACILCSVSFAFAQQNVNATNSRQPKKHLSREVSNPKKAATHMTDEMQKSLQLTEKQYKKIGLAPTIHMPQYLFKGTDSHQ